MINMLPWRGGIIFQVAAKSSHRPVWIMIIGTKDRSEICFLKKKTW